MDGDQIVKNKDLTPDYARLTETNIEQ